jgi:hypothetical protein
MSSRKVAQSFVQYGIQTPNSKTILMVTEDLAEAKHTLDQIGGGNLIARTVSYSHWRSVDIDEDVDVRS